MTSHVCFFVVSASQLRSLALDLQKKFPDMISDVRGWGLIIGIEINPACAFAAPEVRVHISKLSLIGHPSAFLLVT